jgi:hypothetical protein
VSFDGILGCNFFLFNFLLESLIWLNNLLASVASIMLTVELVCKRGKCHVKYYMSIYILVADVISVT